jgi:1-acyl-sn-glycerol-3-phosphate acyltransferase
LNTAMFTLARGVYLVVSIVIFLFSGFCIEVAMTLGRMKHAAKQKLRTRHASLSARRLMKAFGFKIEVKNLDHLRELRSNALLVANHLSFWDALILSAAIDQVTFITSMEVRDMPILGGIARAVGCVFIERRSRDRLTHEVGSVTRELSEGQTVILFPEATTTNGSQILPFKKAFFKAAIEAAKPVLPLCINYLKIDGQPVTHKNRDSLFYYGELNIVAQLYKVLKLRSVHVEVQVLNALSPSQIAPSQVPFAAESHLSTESYNQIFQKYVPIN